MRSLEIRTQIIFNNLIKQNQKLASDFVLKPSIIVPSAQNPASSVQYRPSNVQHPESSIQSPKSSIQSPAPNVQRSESRVQRPESRVQRPESSFQLLRPESRNSSMPKKLDSMTLFQQLRKSISWEWKKNITETIPKRLFEHAFYNWKETTKGTIALIRNKLF